MITEPTVFVLGAGASMPYGYPSGSELRDTICEYLSSNESSQFKYLYELGCKAADIRKFRTALLYSGKPSVDAFLEYRPEFLEIGRTAIAQVLIPCEQMSKLFTRSPSKKNDDRWYEYFYQQLDAPFENFDQNKVSIITFNYDRSLEHFLFTSLKHSYGKTDEECASKLQNIPIVHVYGQLDYLPWQKDGGRQYNYHYVVDDLLKSAKEIKIVHEDVDLQNDPAFTKANSVLNEAKQIYFLGFGYHPQNVERLNIPSSSVKTHAGTAYDLEPAQQVLVKGLFALKDISITLSAKTMDTLLFLKTHVPFT